MNGSNDTEVYKALCQGVKDDLRITASLILN